MTPSSRPLGWPALLVLCAAQALVVFDQTIVGVALPVLGPALELEPASLSWVANGYLVAFGGLSLLGGRLADLFGARRILLVGFIALAVSSLVAGAAPSLAWLVVGRVAQGASSALAAPAALTLVIALYGERPAELRRMLAIWGAAAGVGGAAGVILGGAFIEWASWRWAFLIDSPIAVGCALGVRALVPQTSRRRISVDVAGALMVTAGIALALYAIVSARRIGLASTGALALAALSLLVGFVFVERRRRSPLVPLAVLHIPHLAIGNVLIALLGAAYFPLWFFLNIHVQDNLGIRGLTSGLLLVPMRLVYLVLSLAVTERLIARIGARPALVLGLSCIAAALTALALAPSRGTFASGALLPSLLGAAGMAFAYVPVMMISTRAVPPQMHGLSSGILGTSYQLGSAIGLAATGAVWSYAGLRSAVTAACGLALAAVFLALYWGRSGAGARRRGGRPAPSPDPIVVGPASTARTRRTREA